jgi:hypothetical protein
MRRNKQHAASLWLAPLILLLFATPAHASFLHGETLDAVANVLAWAVLFIVPAVGITVFWLLHILPEKIAEKKHHPQTSAIQTLCLLSLFFGGLLWPLAWLWAYSKPVFYKMAYGTDAVPHGQEDPTHPTPGEDQAAEIQRLRSRLAELESEHADRLVAEGRVA